MRALHLVKTTEGATWAARQCAILHEMGVEVHVALPSSTGTMLPLWRASGAQLHIADVSLRPSRPLQTARALHTLRALVARIQPDVLHSHFVATTLAMRMALGPHRPAIRIFQVPGPLHLEHTLPRRADLLSAGPADHWLASSQAIARLYLAAGVPADRVHHSYYGNSLPTPVPASGTLHRMLGLPPATRLVGNINWMYPPKRWLGHRIGVKAHEHVIQAIATLAERHDDVAGVFIGGEWGGGHAYLDRLAALAERLAPGRIHFPGAVPEQEVGALWADFTLALHAPISENCGGVVEPMACRVPVVAAAVGGLPELVEDGVTGWLVPPGRTDLLIAAAEQALAQREEAALRAERAHTRVHHLFDVRRTATEVHDLYARLLSEGAHSG